MITVHLVIAALCAIPVLVRALCIVAHITRSRSVWPRWRYLLFSLSAAALGAGAVGVVVGQGWGGLVLLAGSSGLILFDRRQRRQQSLVEVTHEA